MFGMRTPVRRQSADDRTSPNKNGEKSVRLSIGEWEAGHTSSIPNLTQASQSKPKQATHPSTQDGKGVASDKTFIKTTTSPKRWPTGRISEARACLNKGKLNLENSRNLKTEIKIGVIEALDRLYALVKEAEAETRKGKAGTESKGPKDTSQKVTQDATPRPQSPDRDQNQVAKTLEEHTRLLLENNRKLQEIQDRMDSQKELLDKVTARTFASVAAQQPEKKKEISGTLHSVIVTSKDENETGEEVLEKIRRVVDAKEGWVRVERVRKGKNRKVIMGCNSEEDRKRIKDRIVAAEEHLLVEDAKNKDPLLVLRDVLKIHTDEEIIKALRNQNRELFDGLSEEEDRIKVKYRRKARNPHSCHVVLTVSPVVWRRALEIKRLRVDLQRVLVEDQSPLVQCTRCLEYGHGKKLCKEPVDLCSHCGGPHLRAECTARLADEVPTCINCARAKMVKSDHNAFSGECPVRKRWDALARMSIAYC